MTNQQPAQTTPDDELTCILLQFIAEYHQGLNELAGRGTATQQAEKALTAWAKNKALRAVGEDESEIVHERLSDERAEIRNDIKDEIRSNIHREFREV
jgi:hypothetical protein